jgi:hypothetical protein
LRDVAGTENGSRMSFSVAGVAYPTRRKVWLSVQNLLPIPKVYTASAREPLREE